MRGFQRSRGEDPGTKDVSASNRTLDRPAAKAHPHEHTGAFAVRHQRKSAWPRRTGGLRFGGLGRSTASGRAARREYPLKRAMDQWVAILALVGLGPLFLIVAGLIHFGDRGPVFFAQSRLGYGGRSFRCLKFRTMLVGADAALARHLEADPEAMAEWKATRKLKDDPRITPIGKILRRTSLDELPQLINIARGEMSLVGPRPIVREEADYYGEVLGDYLSVRPGLTGLWQISGRNDIGYEERVRIDAHYVLNISLAEDLRIILRTVVAVLARRGSY